ncbi:MAG: hypothetical protein A3I75_06520 [Deltaproteobacteria bacterium RIFCSPLOWO2_02_FULL_50_16]|nr:MAG: hypothetical protein A2053_00635 [Deltaproteobacteria bacterium GWA2_50_8]OGQ25653.1 MAG: hypothetical protein A3B79_00090 [Deltaproteobacteria bacterium RIFCSPHIGHO2_02_FULL_50_15]OGQ56574.1 MAG: hypothetical protein A3I75_06520 [Deltaproteobacteria bacterium RIFCSPLOWO2_02_FULL_50_16]OGQ65563.1 MAG: hypothetical protein A3F89_04290 [Deltaproteobacteria bacterium RIFCSPLOWO2_12_FULL_50_11]
MTEFDWFKSRDKLKQLVDEGLHFLREGAIEAQHITETTIDRIKTELEIKRLISHINHLKILLGSETIKLFNRIPDLKANKIIGRLIHEIRLGESDLKVRQQQIDKMTVVKKKSSKRSSKKKKA